jgi:DNA-binding transcriptional regulator YdaS (Cro superfamily)
MSQSGQHGICAQHGRAIPLAGVRLAAKAAGGMRPLARLLGIAHPALYRWRQIPAGRIVEIERLTGVPRHLLRPDLYKGWSGAIAQTKTDPAYSQPLLPTELHLPPIKQRIYDAVRRRPDISAEQLRCIVWADDPNGGPEDRKCLHVHVAQLNVLLRPLGVMVRSAGGGYRVRPS